ncbi:MAG TPA: hypothetical protein VF603_07260 [Allosphingosinicella sp.]|jgi:hypothetical protein
MATQAADDADAEFGAIQTVYTTLRTLDDEARRRVLEYVGSRFGIQLRAPQKGVQTPAADEADESEEPSGKSGTPASFTSFAELHDAAQPKSQPERALVAGYWLQVCEGADSFDSQSANTALKHLGLGVANITSAIESLKGQKPALALQLKKSGKSRQARKTYKITVAGVKAVEAMING